MQEFTITPSMISEAEFKADKMGVLNNSLLSGKGNLSGFIGELAVKSILNGKIDNTYDWDLILEDGSTVDVKTQAVNSIPRPHYDCNVNEHSTKQKCDFYAFTRILSNLSRGWYLGIISKKKLLEKARFNKAGSPAANFMFRFNCYTIPIKDINDS